MKRLVREPLLHFFVLGALLFGLYGALNRNVPTAPNEILVSQNEIRSLQAQFERVWQRAPTQLELKGLIDSWIRDEIFYREGLAMGLDRDDAMIRRRVGQKLAFILESATPAPPTTQELQSWLDGHAARYMIQPVFSLRQIYFDPTRHSQHLDAEIAEARSQLERGASVPGDSTLLPARLLDTQSVEIARTFGTEFAKHLMSLPIGSWQGPIRSTFGMHLVEVSARQESRKATLDEVRNEVERDLLQARVRDASEAIYSKLRASYAVRVEDNAIAADPRG